MLEDMTNTELIEFALENPESSPEAMELATRLQYAVDELDRMSAMLSKLEGLRGTDT